MVCRWNVGAIPLLLLSLTTVSQAAPKLRLTTTTVGPVSIAQAGNANAQTVEAFNAGDGNLALQTSASVAWLGTNVGSARSCTLREGDCIPVNITFNTASLARGTYTGVVTVNDPNALDAPQNITVTVQIGGGVPDSVNLYVAPNGSTDEVRLSSNSNLSAGATTQSGGPWLSVGLDGTGSFRFTYPFRIIGRHLEGMAEGVYNGTINVAGSSIATENKAVPVRLQVTSQPIARASMQQVEFRIATGSSAQSVPLGVFNGGTGTLTVSAASATTASGGDWLSVETSGNSVTVKANPANVPEGAYTGTVTVNSNGVNSSLTVPVRLSIVAQGAPLATFSRVVNSGNFDEGLAPGSVAAVYGEQLSYQEPAQNSALPLADSVGGARVLVNDLPAPVLFSSYNQVNFQIPYETAEGESVIRVERDGTPGNALAVLIAPRAPRIIQIGNSGVVVNADGSQTIGGRPSKPGEVITIYLVGLGATTSPATTGAAVAAQPLSVITPAPKVVIGSAFMGAIVVDPIYVGLTPGVVGLYQATLQLPHDIFEGDIQVAIEGDGYRSNSVLIPIRQ
jgi:uncharacterized protein (TIGR03437 family)